MKTKAPQMQVKSPYLESRHVTVLLDGDRCSPPEYALLKNLWSHPNVELTVLAGCGRGRSIYRAYLWVETLVLSLVVGRLKAFRERKEIDFVEVRPLNVLGASLLETKATLDANPSIDAKNAQDANSTLDADTALHANTAPRSTENKIVLDFRGGHLGQGSGWARSIQHPNGLRLHFGPDPSNANGPAGFWEMISKAGASGIYLMNGSECIFSGRYKTKRLLSLNAESVYREGLFDIATVLGRWAATGILPSLPVNPNVPAAIGETWHNPNIIQLIQYGVLTVGRELVLQLRTRFLGQTQRFGVEILKGGWDQLAAAEHGTTSAYGFTRTNNATGITDTSVTTGTTSVSIPNPPGRYFADPFVLERGGKTICFVEDYEYDKDKGRISVVDLTSGAPLELGCAIDEPFHMSFPFLLEHEGELYMIPETFQDGRISMYRCTDFPLKWERHATLMDGVEASDTTLFERDGKWWMLTNLRPEGCIDFYSRLFAFYADSPLSTEWIPHDLNPILVDAKSGRNAGILRGSDGERFRIGQHQGMHVYGKACAVQRIHELTPHAYREESEAHLSPATVEPVSERAGLIGTHHMDASANWTVFDVVTWERPGIAPEAALGMTPSKPSTPAFNTDLSSRLKSAAVLLLLLFSVLFGVSLAHAQVDGISDIEGPIHAFLIRQQAAGNLDGAHLSHKPISAYDARSYLRSLTGLTGTDEKLRLQYLNLLPSPGAKGINKLWSVLYGNGLDFYSTGGNDYGDEADGIDQLGEIRPIQTSEQSDSTEGFEIDTSFSQKMPVQDIDRTKSAGNVDLPTDSTKYLEPNPWANDSPGYGYPYSLHPDSLKSQSESKVKSTELPSSQLVPKSGLKLRSESRFLTPDRPRKGSWGVQLNPILHLTSGTATFSSDPKDRKSTSVWRNTRGLRLSGHVGRHIYFEGRLTENQEKVVDGKIEFETSPGRPFTLAAKDGAYDWMDSRAIVGFQFNHFDIRVGRDENLWGYGARSVMMGNSAATFDQVQLRTTLGRFQFTNLFAAPLTRDKVEGNGVRLRKYMASHRLAVKLGKRMELAIFETVMFGTDSLQTRSRFDLAYINPIIFLSVAERDRGSPDNYMVGISGSLRPDDGTLLYGEYLLDEFKADEMGNGWWANKWAWMAGAYFTNTFIKRSDLRIEIAQMRPFLYSHGNAVNSFTHLGDPLGHLSGPNSQNLFAEFTWPISRRIGLKLAADITKQGLNSATENLGSDPNISNETRKMDYGNNLFQGIRKSSRTLNAAISIELLPNAFLDAAVWHVNHVIDGMPDQTFLLPTFGVRWNASAPRSLPK